MVLSAGCGREPEVCLCKVYCVLSHCVCVQNQRLSRLRDDRSFCRIFSEELVDEMRGDFVGVSSVMWSMC